MNFAQLFGHTFAAERAASLFATVHAQKGCAKFNEVVRWPGPLPAEAAQGGGGLRFSTVDAISQISCQPWRPAGASRGAGPAGTGAYATGCGRGAGGSGHAPGRSRAAAGTARG